MTTQGKRLLLITVGAMGLLFGALYLYAGHLTAGKGKPVPAPPPKTSTPAAAVLPEDGGAKGRDLTMMPAQKLSSTLLGKARDLYEANRLRDAVIVLEMSLFLDEENAHTKVWLAEVEGQLQGLVQEYASLGNADYLNKRYDRAIYNWERVLFLLKDKTSPTAVQTLQKIDAARERARR
jgi:tetratricopeptide (TPR) repeat protein